MTDKAMDHISEANQTFSNKLYEILSKTKGNVFYSPISVHAILSLVYQGAAGETAESIEKGLHLVGTEITAEGYQCLMEQLNSVNNVTLHIANKVFVHHERTLRSDFDEIAKKQFFAEAENIAFLPNKTGAAGRINSWVESKTNRKIRDVIQADALNEDTRLILISAIYFKGDWRNKFDPKRTKKEKFYLNETDTITCDMMHMTEKFRYGEDVELDAQILNMPYKNGHLNMMIILPRSKTGIDTLEKKIVSNNLKELNKNLFTAEIFLSLPKFKIETTMDLNEPLSQLGMDVMFTNRADFANMLNHPEPLAINKVIQKAFIEVSEEGTEAAAATVMFGGFGSSSIPPPRRYRFRVDHPCIFILYYGVIELFPLFVGRLTRI